MAEFVDSQYFPEGYAVPDPNDALSRGFWEAAREGRLVVQQCRDCPTVQHPPEVLCHTCHSFDLGWKEVSGRATIYSFTRTVPVTCCCTVATNASMASRVGENQSPS